jgi:hypothetical protein
MPENKPEVLAKRFPEFFHYGISHSAMRALIISEFY